MQKSILFTTGLVALIGTTVARISSGACSTPNLQSGFDITKYTGTWYEIRRDAEFYFEKNGECVTA
jgi:lipocalin